MDAIIKTAAYPFRCLLCDDVVRTGDVYVEVEHEKLCVTCGLPARRLRPLKRETIKNVKTVQMTISEVPNELALKVAEKAAQRKPD